MLSLLVLAALTAAPAPSWRPLGLSPPLDALLRTGRWDSTPRGFRVVALSHLSDACAAQGEREPPLLPAARACVDRALELAWASRPDDAPVEVSDHGLWWSHLNLILGARDRLGADPDPCLHERVSTALARRSLAEPTRHLPSYPGHSERWPADQTATLASLGRFDRAHGADLAAAPLGAWRAFMRASGLAADGALPRSEVTGKAPGARHPRGCAQSWMTRYLSEVDPPLAALWWSTYRRTFFTQVGPVAGFREWPPGVDRGADVDSGPIVFGIGAAASALAISAARAQGDEALAASLERSAKLAESLVGDAAAKTALA